MRQLLPRRRRGAGLRGLGVLAVALVLAGCLGDGGSGKSDRGDALVSGDGFSVGLYEPNPSLFATGNVSGEFGRWRDRVAAIDPALYRLIVDWAHLQPDPDQPAQLAAGVSGCMRDIEPCAAYGGVQDVLRAVAARQAQGDDWSVVVTIYGVPEWAAVEAQGCERPSIEPRSRAINAAGLRAYRRLIADLVELGESTGAQLRFWAPWNEPNQVFFISPQRTRCDPSAQLLSPAVYTRIFRAAAAELDKAPGDQQLVLGELSATQEPQERAATPREFLRALPDDVVCAASVLAQHQYVDSPVDAVAEAVRETDGRRCDGGPLPVWITETGVGDRVKPGRERPLGDDELRQQCRRYHERLVSWRDDGRVRAIIQYTAREDPAFRVGLVNASLTRAYPTLELLRSWGRRDPGDPAPSLPDVCAG